MREMNREMELNMDELGQVNGGVTFCVGIGFSTNPTANFCWLHGHTTEDEDKYGAIGVNACAYVGVGIGAGDEKNDTYGEYDEYWPCEREC